MTRVAVFVDAGYLFAQGSTALAGIKQPRQNLRLNETAAIAELRDVATSCSGGCGLLRIYWYDGVNSYKGPTLDQMTLAHTDGVKLRLGFINSMGQQKGVDSLIVTDLIDLARNHAICDALLLSGDEDVRIGVQIAQQFGVRVHLLGIEPSRGSQSKQLLQEADTTTVWNAATVAKFLTVAQTTAAPVPATSAPASPVPASAPSQVSFDPAIEAAISSLISELDAAQIAGLKTHWQTLSGVPPEYDGKLLGKSRDALGRDLTMPEKRTARTRFKTRVNAL